MKTVLITGGAGYIGSHIGYLLSLFGYRIVILDKLVYEQSFDHPWARLIQADFGDEKQLDEIFLHYQIYAVIHCAALIEVGASVTHPLPFYQNNVAKTVTLLETMLKYDVKTILFSSSCAVFGEPKTLRLNENHSFNPISPYGRTKYMMEMIIKDMGQAYGFSYVIFRFFNAAGACPQEGLGEQHTPETHLIPLLLRACLEQRPFFIFGDQKPTPDGSCIRDFVHVLDIAKAHLVALEYLDKGNASDIFNLGTGKGISVKEMIEAVECHCGKKVQIVTAPDRQGDPALLVADPTKANTILGWYPEYSDIDSIIDSAYSFMCRYQHISKITQNVL